MADARRAPLKDTTDMAKWLSYAGEAAHRLDSVAQTRANLNRDATYVRFFHDSILGKDTGWRWKKDRKPTKPSATRGMAALRW